MKSLAKHVLAEFYGCDPVKINDEKYLSSLFEEAARVSNATVIKTMLHKFSPQGVSGVVILAESHLAVHTWPEHGYAAVEIFTCGDHTTPEAGIEYIQKQLKPKHHEVRVLDRGVMEEVSKYHDKN